MFTVKCNKFATEKKAVDNCTDNHTARNHVVTISRINQSLMLYIWQSFEKETNKVQERVKKDEAREIDLIPEVLEIVEEVKRRRLELGLPVDGFIFPVDDKFMSLYKAIDKMMPKYCQELGINRHTPHDTRRTFVSQIHRNGAPAATIMELTGHRDYETFENSYLFDAEGHEQKKNYIRSALVGK